MWRKVLFRRMKYEVVFFDIDGTLLDQNKKLPDSAKQAVRDLQSRGYLVVIATGREPSMFSHVRAELNIDSFISCNGSYVVHEGEVIDQQPIDAHDLNQLNNEALKNGHGMVFSNIDELWSSAGNHPYIEAAMNELGVEYPAYKPSRPDNIFYALLFCNESEEDLYRHKYEHLDFIRWHEHSLDVIARGGSKAKGIEKLLNHLAIDKERAIAFGDGLNDIEMLNFVGTGVAMGNAARIVKDAADVITKDVAEHGIRFGLEKMGLL